MIYKSKKSQSILDFVLVFGIILVFLVGLVRIWVWFNANYAKRNVDYQSGKILEGNVGRLKAGKANNATAGVYRDKTLTLNDDWIFGGKTNERVGLPPIVSIALDGSDGDPNEDVCANARESAANLREQAHSVSCQARDLADTNCYGDDSCEAERDNGVRSLGEQVFTLQEEADTVEMDGCNSIQPYQAPAGCP